MHGQDELFAAISAGDGGRVRDLVLKSPGVRCARNEQGVSAVMFSAYHRQPEVTALLIERRDDLDAFESAAVGDVDRLAVLNRVRAASFNENSSDGFTPLHLAAFFGQHPAASALVRYGANVEAVSANAMGIRPIHAAAVAGRLDTMAMLLESGADVNARQEGGFTALHEAAHTGKTEMIGMLLDHGADTTLQTDAGKRPRDLAQPADDRL